MVAPAHLNPYEPGNLIWVTTPPLERTSKLSLKWIGHYWVVKVPNHYQVVYATGAGTYIILSQRCWTSFHRKSMTRMILLQLLHWIFSQRFNPQTGGKGVPKSPLLSLADPLPPHPGGLTAGLQVPHPIISNRQCPAQQQRLAQRQGLAQDLQLAPQPLLTPCRPMKMQQVRG